MVEVLEKRTRTSKTHDIGNGKFALDAAIGAVHYQDGWGNWQDINNNLKSASAPWDWVMDEAGYKIEVLENFTYGQILKYSVGGSFVAFQPMALEWTNNLDQIQQISMPQSVSPEITNESVELLPGMSGSIGAIRWSGGYGSGLDFTWRATPSRLKKILTIANLSDLPLVAQYIIDGGEPVLRLNLIFAPSSDLIIYVDGKVWDKKNKKLTFNGIEFRKDGGTVFSFAPLMYWDSSDSTSRQSVATLEKRGGSLYISIRVPYSWLQTAVFPVLIDTDVDEQVGAGDDDAYLSWYETYIGRTTNPAKIGDENGTYNKFGVALRFATVAIPNGATIGVAYLSLCAYGNQSGVTCNARVSAEDVDDAADWSGLTWAQFLANRWVNKTASVDWDAIGAWTSASWYNSPSIVTPVKTVVDRVGWATGQDMAFFVEDSDARSSTAARRAVWQYNGDTALAAKLHVEWSAGVGGLSIPVAMATYNRRRRT